MEREEEEDGWWVDQCSRARPTTLCRDSMMRRLLGVKVVLLMAATRGSGPPCWRPTTFSRIWRSLAAAFGDTLAWWGSAPPAALPYLLAIRGELPSLVAPPGKGRPEEDSDRSRDKLRPF